MIQREAFPLCQGFSPWALGWMKVCWDVDPLCSQGRNSWAQLLFRVVCFTNSTVFCVCHSTSPWEALLNKHVQCFVFCCSVHLSCHISLGARGADVLTAWKITGVDKNLSATPLDKSSKAPLSCTYKKCRWAVQSRLVKINGSLLLMP
jgi:hypothetical protein